MKTKKSIKNRFGEFPFLGILVRGALVAGIVSVGLSRLHAEPGISRGLLHDSMAGVKEAWENRNLQPHSQEVHWIHPSLDDHGKWLLRTNRYIQLESGLNYLSQKGLWEPSLIDIEALEGGGAVARHGQHTVRFSGQFNTTNTIEMRLPDGANMVSHVHGMAYYDPTQDRAVLIGEAQDADAWLYPPNQILYPNAFQSVSADVRYTYTKAGLEQDIILRQAPPPPEGFGLNPDATRLEVWTEFVQAPTPGRHPRKLPIANGSGTVLSLDDDELDFGSMRIGTGRTFTVGAEDTSLALVAKQWVVDGGRQFLIEAVVHSALNPAWLTLPPSSSGGASMARPIRSHQEAMHRLPVRSQAVPKKGVAIHQMTPAMMAQSTRKPGLVLDYYTVNSGLTNYRFQSDTTYLITGPTSVSGSLATFEGGTVLKYAQTNTARLQINTPIAWLGDFYQPVVFTAADDSTVGEQTSSRTPSGYYADTALDLETPGGNNAYTLGHLRIAYAKTGILLDLGAGHSFSHVQILNCLNGIRPLSTDFSLRNALFVNVLTNLNGVASTGRVEHLTVDGASWFNANGTFSSSNLSVTNSILAGVTNLGGYTGTGVSVLPSATGVFQSGGGGSHYLADGSPYRDVGVASINSNLVRDFRWCTTFPPLIWTNSVVANTTLTPTTQRDTDAPDLGYHYPALDYYLPSPISVTNATLTLANGAALGFAGGSCVWLQGGASLSSVGWAFPMNVLTRSSTVQESPAAGTANPQSSDSIVNGYTGPNPVGVLPSVNMKWTSMYMNTPVGYQFYADFSTFFYSSILLRDCQLYGGTCYLQASGSPYASTTVFGFYNNLIYRNTWDVEGFVQFSFFNHLALNSSFYFGPGGTNNAWVARDNAFDNSNVLADNTNAFAYSNNAYIGTNGLSQLLPIQSSDKVFASFSYTNVPNGLGRWYQGQTNLVDVGSQLAGLSDLYHETTQPNQIKEANTRVDIGFHYVAVDSLGNPLDADSDGFPDYVEDANGNGTVDSGETDWNSGSDMGFRIYILQPRSNSDLP